MSLLLDTQARLWWLAGDSLEAGIECHRSDRPRGGERRLDLGSGSQAIARQSLGKLTTPGPLGQAALEAGFEPLAIGFEHAQAASELPRHHRDPFDRMLIAQALIEGLTIVTRDRAFRDYDVAVVAC